MFSVMTVEVFKTNVQEKDEAAKIINMLRQHLPDRRITFDLHDCDKVLRVEGRTFDTEQVKLMVRQNGFYCAELE